MQNLQYLKKISIRGRFAIGLTCVKLLLRDQGLHHNDFIRIYINKLGDFTKAEKLDIWEIETMLYFPDEDTTAQAMIESINKLNIDFAERKKISRNDWYDYECEILSADFYENLIAFYKNPQNEKVLKIIDLCFELSRDELYGQMSMDSICTIETLNEIFTIANFQNEFCYEKIARNYPFSEADGWGKTFDFKTFKRK